MTAIDYEYAGRWLQVPKEASNFFVVRAQSPNPFDEMHGPFADVAAAKAHAAHLRHEFEDYTAFSVENIVVRARWSA